MWSGRSRNHKLRHNLSQYNNNSTVDKWHTQTYSRTIKARERPDKTIVLSVYSAFNNKVYHIYDQFRPKHFNLEITRDNQTVPC